MVSKKVDAQKISTNEDAVAFMIKYDKHQNLQNYKSELLELFLFLEQFSFHKSVRIEKEFYPANGKRKYARDEYRERIISLNKFKVKIRGWYDRPVAKALKKFEQDIDDLIDAYKEAMPDSEQGKHRTSKFRLLASTTKAFWLETLNHDFFIYDDNNRNDDWAVDFVNDLVMALFVGSSTKQIKKLPQAFKDISDSRTKK